MSHGVPSVVTAVGGNCEVVVEGVTGYLVLVDDDEKLSHQITEILTSPDLGQKMGIAARHRATNSFSIQKMMTEYLKLYQPKG
jgi:glycosyltransferase involved in cell wall biosynthesis